MENAESAEGIACLQEFFSLLDFMLNSEISMPDFSPSTLEDVVIDCDLGQSSTPFPTLYSILLLEMSTWTRYSACNTRHALQQMQIVAPSDWKMPETEQQVIVGLCTKPYLACTVSNFSCLFICFAFFFVFLFLFLIVCCRCCCLISV